MIWPFNFAERKARKLGRAKIMLAGYEQRLKRIQAAFHPGGTATLALVFEEQDAMTKVAELKAEIIALGGEVKP